MNTKRGSRTLVTCVAVIITILLTACSSQEPEITAATTPPAVSTQPSTPPYDITRNTPAGYDEWEISGSNEVEQYMQQAAILFGLPSIFVGQGSYATAPYIGITPLETHCVVTFSEAGASPKKGTVSLVILSRFNPDLTIIEPGVTVGKMKARIDSYRAMCRGEAPVPTSQQPASVTSA